MSTTLTSNSLAALGQPVRRYRAASLRQVFAYRAQVWAQGLWCALERFAQRRAQAELLRTAALYRSSQPHLADQLQRLATQRLD